MGKITNIPKISQHLVLGRAVLDQEIDDNFKAVEIALGLLPILDPFSSVLVYEVKAADLLANIWEVGGSPFFTPYWQAFGQDLSYGIIQLLAPTMLVRGDNGAVDPELEVINGKHNIRFSEEVYLYKETDFDTGIEVVDADIYFWDGGNSVVGNSEKFSASGTLTKEIMPADEETLLHYKNASVNPAAGFGQYHMWGGNYKGATNTNGSASIVQTQVDVARMQHHLIFEFFSQSANALSSFMDDNTNGSIRIFVVTKTLNVLLT